MYTKLKGTPIAAEEVNFCSDCKYPVKTPIIPLNKIIGDPILTNFTAKLNCSPSNPLANNLTI